MSFPLRNILKSSPLCSFFFFFLPPSTTWSQFPLTAKSSFIPIHLSSHQASSSTHHPTYPLPTSLSPALKKEHIIGFYPIKEDLSLYFPHFFHHHHAGSRCTFSKKGSSQEINNVNRNPYPTKFDENTSICQEGS